MVVGTVGSRGARVCWQAGVGPFEHDPAYMVTEMHTYRSLPAMTSQHHDVTPPKGGTAVGWSLIPSGGAAMPQSSVCNVRSSHVGLLHHSPGPLAVLGFFYV